jgi:hypothetical protein
LTLPTYENQKWKEIMTREIGQRVKRWQEVDGSRIRLILEGELFMYQVRYLASEVLEERLLELEDEC